MNISVRSRWTTFKNWAGRDKMGLFFSVILLAFFVVAATAPWITPYDPYGFNTREALQSPSWLHIFGTDKFGRDIFSRVIIGTRVSIRIAVVTVLVSLMIGVPIGMFAGFVGGKAESVTMRFVDILLIFPPVLIGILIMAILGTTETTLIMAMISYGVPQFVRISRGEVLSIKEKLYIEAARALGTSKKRIIFRHILPNISAPILVQSTLLLPVVVLTISTLSYLGIGIQPPTPEWGSMLKTAKEYLQIKPELLIGPGIALFLFVLATNIVGDSVQEIVNPQLRSIRRKG